MSKHENWDDMRYFLAVARQGLPVKAAAELGVSYVTVLRRLSALEDRLAVKLFRRIPSGYELTPAGRELRRSAERMEETVKDFTTHVRTSEGDVAGTLVIACGDGIGLNVITRHLAAFQARFPEVRVELQIDQLISALQRRESRLCFRPMRATTSVSDKVVRTRICAVPTAFYAAADYVARRGRPEGIADLARHALVNGSESINYVESVAWVEEHIGAAPVAMRANTMGGMFHMVRRGVGIGALPCLMAADAPDLVQVLPPMSELGTELWSISTLRLARTALVQAFVEHLVDAARADDDWINDRRAA